MRNFQLNCFSRVVDYWDLGVLFPARRPHVTLIINSSGLFGLIVRNGRRVTASANLGIPVARAGSRKEAHYRMSRCVRGSHCCATRRWINGSAAIIRYAGRQTRAQRRVRKLANYHGKTTFYHPARHARRAVGNDVRETRRKYRSGEAFSLLADDKYICQ